MTHGFGNGQLNPHRFSERHERATRKCAFDHHMGFGFILFKRCALGQTIAERAIT